MASLLDDQYRNQLETVLDSERETLLRLREVSDLVAHLEGVRNDLAARAMREGHTMREVAAAADEALGTAQRHWGHLNPRARSTA